MPNIPGIGLSVLSIPVDLISLTPPSDVNGIELESGTGVWTWGSSMQPIWGSSSPITDSTLNAPGTRWTVNDTFLVNAVSFNATGVVDTTTVDTVTTYPITSLLINTISAIVSLDQMGGIVGAFGDRSGDLTVDGPFFIQGSTANDGQYTITDVNFVSGDNTTYITVTVPFPDATVDGSVYALGWLGISGDHTSEIANNATGIVAGSTGNDAVYVFALVEYDMGSDTTRLWADASQPVQDATVDGTVRQLGGIGTYHLTAPGTAYYTATGVPLLATGGSIGQDATLDITAGTP